MDVHMTLMTSATGSYFNAFCYLTIKLIRNELLSLCAILCMSRRLITICKSSSGSTQNNA